MRRFIRDQFPGANVAEVNGSIAELARWQEQDERDRHDIDLLLGHQYFGNHAYLRDGASYVTVLRNPIERVISFYYYVLRMPDHYLYRFGFEPHMSLREMYKNTGCIELDNLQVRMLNPQPEFNPPMGTVNQEMLEIAEANLQFIADHGVVGVVERMPELLSVFERDEGWDPTKMTRSNATSHRPAAESLDAETLDIIAESNRYDLRLYELACKLFEDRFTPLSSDAAAANNP